MTACLESSQRSKMDPVTSNWKLTVTDRRLMCASETTPRRMRSETSALGIRSIQGSLTAEET